MQELVWRQTVVTPSIDFFHFYFCWPQKNHNNSLDHNNSLVRCKTSFGCQYSINLPWDWHIQVPPNRESQRDFEPLFLQNSHYVILEVDNVPWLTPLKVAEEYSDLALVSFRTICYYIYNTFLHYEVHGRYWISFSCSSNYCRQSCCVYCIIILIQDTTSEYSVWTIVCNSAVS